MLHKNRTVRQWALLALVFASALVSTAGCNDKTATFSKSIIEDVDKVMHQSDEVGRMRVGPSFTADSQAILDRAKTGQLTNAAQAAIRRLQTEHDFQVARFKALDDFDARVRGVEAFDMPAILDSWLLPEAKAKVTEKMRQELVADAKQVLHDVVCDIAWNALSADEARVTKFLKENGQFLNTYISFGQDILKMAAISAGRLVGQRLLFYFSKRVFGRTDIVNWTFYGLGVYEKGRDLVLHETENLPTPEPGSTVSHAYVYYFHVCMEFPKS